MDENKETDIIKGLFYAIFLKILLQCNPVRAELSHHYNALML